MNNETTNEEIKALRTEAAQAGDLEMVEICDMALIAQHPDPRFFDGHVAVARRHCEQAILAARAQS